MPPLTKMPANGVLVRFLLQSMHGQALAVQVVNHALDVQLPPVQSPLPPTQRGRAQFRIGARVEADGMLARLALARNIVLRATCADEPVAPLTDLALQLGAEFFE